MKLFLDTANISLIKEWASYSIIDGVTTNPSLLSKEGLQTREMLQEMCLSIQGDVSIEVVTQNIQDIYREAHEIAELAPNAVVKIPFIKNYLPIIQKLVHEKVALNITLIFSLMQALIVAKMGVKYVSPFIARWDDLGINGISLLQQLRTMIDTYHFQTQILAASIRSTHQLQEAVLAGADVATVPPLLLETIMNHPLTERGLKKFNDDWAKLNVTSLFSQKKEPLI